MGASRKGDVRMSRPGRRILIGGLVVVGLAVAVFAARFGTDAGRGVSPVIGARTPDLALPRLEETGTVELRALEDSYEVVVINFFASWCIQCRNEHADLVSTADAYNHRSVRFLGIVFQDRPARAITFLDELGRGATTEYVTDPGARAAIEFGIFGVPETIFIRDGEIVGKLLGETDALGLSGVIEQILAGEAVGSRQVGEYRQGPEDQG